jgi:hypothetical protein
VQRRCSRDTAGHAAGARSASLPPAGRRSTVGSGYEREVPPTRPRVTARTAAGRFGA